MRSLIAIGTPEELKTQLMQDQVLNLQCERPQDAIEMLEAITAVKEVALFGSGLHVVVHNAATASHDIREALLAADVRIDRIESINPSMEDVFVSLVEARDRIVRAA